MEYFLIALIPFAIAALAKISGRFSITGIEVIAQGLLGLMIVGLASLIAHSASLSDIEVISGQVTSKERVRFSCPRDTMNPCRNSYSCNETKYRTVIVDGKPKQESYTEYHTCYVYPWEQDWHVKSNVGDFVLDRADRRGVIEPVRYTNTNIGDAVARHGRFTNWLKRAHMSLYRGSEYSTEGYENILPEYPTRIYDEYHIDRVLNVGTSIEPNRLREWNKSLQDILGELGPRKKLNTVIVMTKADEGFASALQSHWKGFKQNDAVIVLGTEKGIVKWVDIRSWSREEIFDVKSEAFLNTLIGKPINDIEPSEFMQTYKVIADKNFVRRPMEDFEYLKFDVRPSVGAIIGLIIISILCSIGLTILFDRVDFRPF